MKRGSLHLSGCRVTTSVVLAAIAPVAVMSAEAAIIDGSAAAEILVQQIIEGEPGSVTSERSEAALLAGPFPVTAEGLLASTDLDGVLVSEGGGVASVADPGRLNQPNPEELRLEAECYTTDERTEYVASAWVTERREILFASPDNPLVEPEIDFDADGTRTVESSLFLSGALFLWASDDTVDLSRVQGGVDVRVHHGDETALVATLALGVDGAGDAAFTVTGPMAVTPITLDDLANQDTLDEEALESLHRIDETGTLLILAIPDQRHTYRYEVEADVPSELEVEARIDLRTPSGGVGLAATLGGPFEQLASYVAGTQAGLDGEAVERAINSAVASADADSVTPTSATVLCGALGVEALIGLAAPLGIAGGRRRRWRPPAA